MTDAAPVPPPFVARIPTAFFGAVLGLGGLANGWRVAGRLWGVPGWIGDAVAARNTHAAIYDALRLARTL